eukprot:scaffold29290_cov31-Tisochrysis_lutea.AAC.4
MATDPLGQAVLPRTPSRAVGSEGHGARAAPLLPCRHPRRDGRSGHARPHALEAPARGRSPDPGAHETRRVPPPDSRTPPSPTWPTWPTQSTSLVSW